MRNYDIQSHKINNGDELKRVIPFLINNSIVQRSKEAELSKKLFAMGNPQRDISQGDIENMISNISKKKSNNNEKKVDFEKKDVRNNRKLSSDFQVIVEDKERGLKCVVTKDADILQEYYELRNDIFHKDRGWINKKWLESEHDKKGNIMVVLDKNENVVGGARLMISKNGELLSGEIEGTEFVYRKLFESLEEDKSDSNYGEIDGLVVCKKNRDRSVTEMILSSCIKKSLEESCKYLVGIAHPTYCRIYRSAYKSVGYGDVTILKNRIWAEVREYNYSKDCPIINKIS